jgi:FkbM family methyltransferase
MFKIFAMKSFRYHPVITLYRAIIWVLLHILLKRPATISLQVGNATFLLELPPLLHQGGSTGVFVQREYYEPLLEFCGHLIRRGDVIVDCGANQGIYTCAFAKLTGRTGKVIAFEPQTYAIDVLDNNIQINGFTNVVVIPTAVSDHAGSAVLDVSKGAVSASIVRDYGRQGAITVPTVTIDDTIETLNLTQIDILKMDIEGAELVALGGCERLLTRFKPIIILEATPSDPSWRKIVALLIDQHGYQSFLFDDEGFLKLVANVTEDHPNVIFIHGKQS